MWTLSANFVASAEDLGRCRVGQHALLHTAPATSQPWAKVPPRVHGFWYEYRTFVVMSSTRSSRRSASPAVSRPTTKPSSRPSDVVWGDYVPHSHTSPKVCIRGHTAPDSIHANPHSFITLAWYQNILNAILCAVVLLPSAIVVYRLYASCETKVADTFGGRFWSFFLTLAITIQQGAVSCAGRVVQGCRKPAIRLC